MNSLKLTALKSLAKQRKLSGYSKLTKSQLVELLDSQQQSEYNINNDDEKNSLHCDNGVCKLVLQDDDDKQFDNNMNKLFESYRSIQIPESIIKKISKKALRIIAKECNIQNYQSMSVDKLLIEIILDDVSQLLRETMN